MSILDPKPPTRAELTATYGPASPEMQAAFSGKVDKSLAPLNVKDAPYNAKGDGVADDTAAIQAALNTSRDIYIPPGTYRLVAATGFALANTSQRRRRIFGAGDSTLLKLDAGGEGGVLDSTGATLENLAIDGGFDPASAQSNLLSCVQANSNSTVQNLHIYNSRGSCLVGVGSRIAFLNNRLEKFGDHAIYCSGEIATTAPYNILATTTRVVIHGNIIDDTPSYHNGAAGGPVRGSVKLRANCSDVMITNNTINGDQCVLLDGDTRRAESVPRRIIVANNNLLASYSGLQINTAIDANAGDTGIRVNDVTITGNNISGTDTSNTGVMLSRARATISNNIFSTVDGISNFETGDIGASVITNNTFRGSTGIYKPGTGSVIEGNLFDALTGGWAISAFYHCTIRGNVFSGCNVGVQLRTASHATNVVLVQANTFMNNTTALDVGEFARSVALHNNVFTGNTTTALVVSGAAFNGFTTNNNHVISGGSFPTAGSTDGIAVAPVTPVPTVSALPSAASALRGRMVRLVGGAGVADQVYVCRKNAADAYEWAPAL